MYTDDLDDLILLNLVNVKSFIFI